MVSFNQEKNSNEDEEEELYITQSAWIKEVLLHHYYLLTKRKALCCSTHDFWKMTTFETYTLLNWEKEQMEEEEKELNKSKGKTDTSHERLDGDEGLDLFAQMTGRDDGAD